MNIPALCNDVFPHFWIFSSNVTSLIYYSHIPIIIVSLLLGLFVLAKGRKELPNQVLFLTLLPFIAWVFLDSVFWAANNSDVIMFVWSMQILVEPLVYVGSLYLMYLLAYGKDAKLSWKLLISLVYLPILIFTPTRYFLSGFDLSSCLSIETNYSYYSYVIEIFYTVVLISLALKRYKQVTDKVSKNQILYLFTGIFFFLFAFSWGNIASSFTDNWKISQVGLFAMPIFIGFLVYSIVRFKTFNIKLLGAQALVLTMAILIAAQYLFINASVSIYLNTFALVGVIFFGNFLIQGVKREVEQRERLEVLRLRLQDSNTQLEGANEKLKDLDKLKTEFLSLASHQLRSPLTAIKGYASMILDGDFGTINTDAKEAIDRIFQSSQNLAKVVEDLLNVSKIEQGGMKYVMAPFSVAEVARDMEKDLSITAEKRGLKMVYEGDEDGQCMVNGDKEKIRQVVLNFIDNSIKYTKEGSIVVGVKRVENKVVFTVKDTGMGMTKEIMDSLFQKFSRGDGARMNTSGSGLGLYLAKEIVEAHKGKVFLESDGPGKGSTFGMELEALQ